MVNDPNIPYGFESDTPEDDDDWRDLQIAAYNSYDEQYSVSHRRLPDDSWLLPPDFTIRDILGTRYCKLEEIRRDTSASLKLNEAMRQIDIWGDRESVNRACRMLNLITERLQQHKDATKSKGRKWGKPERELTQKEQKRAERKLAKQTEDRTYRRYPDIPFQYKAIVFFPDEAIPSRAIFGAKNEYLNRLRVESRCYMRYNEPMNAVELTHQVDANVIKAAERTRNWYLSICRTIATSVLCILKQPSNNMVVQFRTLPPHFVTFRYASPAQEQIVQRNGRLLEGLTTGVIVDQIPENLDVISTNTDPSQGSISSELSDEIKKLDESNAKKMKTALEVGLESIRLEKWDIRMKLYFGHIVVMQYPRSNVPRSLESFVNKTLPNKNFATEFAPCIAKKIEDLDDVFAWLTYHCTEYTHSPSTSYVIEARQFPSLAENTSSTSRPGFHRRLFTDADQWNTTLIVNFTSEKRVGMWRCLVEQLDVTTIRSADLQDDADWELKLQRAIHMPKDETRDTPHGLFVDGLELSPESDRLVFLPNSLRYDPQLITQKTKWVYAYSDNWTIELIRDEIWDINLLEITPERRYMPVDLSTCEPHRTIFRLAMYREQWKSRLVENMSLELGEAPSWIPASFLKNPCNEKETMESVIDAAQTVKKILNQQKYPL